MSVQVSYKKQTLLGIIGLLILFLAIEIIANVWWVTQINCEFEKNEIFQHLDDTKVHQLCVDLYEIKTSGTELIPNQQSQSISINSLGFRGDDFSPAKPDTTYRIFMLGGSTMFGHGATSDQTTIPGHLQKEFQSYNKEFKIEIINSGIQGADSFNELDLIKTKLLDYNPNLIVIYDGWNDLRAQNSPDVINKNWNSMCQLGVENDFSVMIALQPIAGFGNKILTKQELEYSKHGTNYYDAPLINSLKEYGLYAANLDALSACTTSVDLRMAFDEEPSTIYWDQGHVSDNGNSLVAKVLYDEILQLLPENLSQSIQISDSHDIKNDNLIENQLRYILSSYKTPVMINSVLSFDMTEQKLIEEPKELLFETQSKQYNGDEISISIEISKDLNNSDQKTLEINTINNSDGSKISNVTYFLKILKDDEIILADFFYVEGETFVLDIISNDSNSVDVFGERKYDHNALIANPNSPIKISGPILHDNEAYEFNIELRTIYDPSNWVFVLDDFHVEIVL